ncbi:MAG: cellulose binding domain-containing protein [Lachnospiraceae bacterium]|nr:cellulose binding domain-containing protein [Lachnospiraceae bacterium]
MKRKKLGDRLISAALILAMTVSTLLQASASMAKAENSHLYEGEGYQVVFSITSRWSDGYVADITIQNTGERKIDNWCLAFSLENSIAAIWNAKLDNNSNGNRYIVKNSQYNQDIGVGESVTFGIQVNEPFQKFPTDYVMIGNPQIVEADDYSVEYIVNEDWGSGFSASLVICNQSDYDFEDWTLRGKYENEIDTIWNAQIRDHEDNRYVISGAEYDQNLAAGDSISIGLNCMAGSSSLNFEQLELEFIRTNVENKEPDRGTMDAYTIEDIQKDACILYSAGDCDTSVTRDLTFYANKLFAEYVSWESSRKDIIDDNGKVTRMNQPTEVVITKRVNFEGEQSEEKITVRVAGKCSYEPEHMQDYVLSEIKQMNASDEDFEVMINEEGYLEEIYGTYSNITVDCWEAALYSLYNIKTALGIENPFQELVPQECYHDDTGYSYCFTQVKQGLPVFCRGLVVSCDQQGNINMLSSSYLPFEKEVSVEPEISYRKAVGILGEKFGNRVTIENGEERLNAFRDYGIESSAWLISATLCESCEEMDAGSYTFLVSGEDGTILDYINNSQDVDTCPCMGDDINQNSRQFLGKKEREKYYMEDAVHGIRVYHGSLYDPKHANMVSSNWRDSGWDSGAVSAICNMKEAMDYYGKLTGNSRHSYDGKGGKINIYLSRNNDNDKSEDRNNNFPDNARWDYEAKGFYFGIGTGRSKKQSTSLEYTNTLKKGEEAPEHATKKGMRYASFDIVVHEYTHAVFGAKTDNRIFYYSNGVPNSISEGYSDIMACFAEGDWKIAEDISDSEIGDGCMRNIAKPHLTGNPSKVRGKYYECSKRKNTKKGKELYDELGDDGHSNSTVLSHAAYLMLTKLMKWNSKENYRDELGKLWYATIYLHGSKNIDFYKVRKKVIAKARASSYFGSKEISLIKEAFNECGITKANCQRDTKYFKKLKKDIKKGASAANDIMQLTGRVVKADADNTVGNNLPLSSVQVKVGSLDGHEEEIKGSTASKGQYEIGLDYFEEGVMTFSKSGYLSETMYLSESDSELQNVIYCSTVELISKEQDGQGAASGVVKSATTAKGIGNVELNIRRGIHNIYTDVVMKTVTDSNGKFQVQNLPAGNYTVEVVDPSDEYAMSYFEIKILGDQTIENQDGVISPEMDNVYLRSVLTWGSNPNDLDSHMLCKFFGGESAHVYYADKKGYYNAELVCQLDVDNRFGYGPETITLQGIKPGIYDYYIHHYYGKGTLSDSNASVCLYQQGTEGMKRYTFHVPEGSGKYWSVYRFNSATETIVSVGKMH